MGVKGLWKLLDGTGRPLNLESLEGKVLAVDISVWLNMAIKGMRDYEGHAMANAHLATLFNRICKLLYYGVKPVFVFDGQAPMLKQNTLRERRERLHFQVKESKKASEKILQNYLKKQILEEAVGKSSQDGDPDTSADDQMKKSRKNRVNKEQEADIYELPALSNQLIDSDQDDLEEELKMRTELQDEYIDESGRVDVAGILNMNIDSKDFAALPTDVQYELLKDLKEIRKRRRTALEAMPEESNSFSDYQIAGLLAKRKITKKMESVENKMSEESLASSSVYAGFGPDIFKTHKVDARQIVSDSKSHYVWMRKMDDEKNQIGNSKEKNSKLLPTVEEESPYTDAQSNQTTNERKIINETTSAANIDNALKTETKTDVNSKTVYHSDGKNNDERPLISEENQHIQSDNTAVLQNSIIEEGSSNSNDLKADNPVLDITDNNSDVKNVDSNDLKADTSVIDIIDNNSDVKNFDESEVLLNTGISGETVIEKQPLEGFTTDVLKLSPDENIVPVVEVKAAAVSKTPNTSKMDNFTGESVLNVVQGGGNLPSNSNILVDLSEKNLADEGVASSESSDDEFVDVDVKKQENKKPNEEDEVLDSNQNMEPGDTTDVSKDATEPEIVPESNPWEGLNPDNLEAFAGQLDAESHELRNMMHAKERAARDLSQTAQLECQELLKLFGLPYILSPQEAEAQCATLELLGLTNGTITEDSDIWLFGGKYVIKDMFSSKRDPVAFNAMDIEMQLGLNRDRFICVALCTGSDYTTGLHGVGPVTAMEILREFSGDGIDGLIKLRSWWDDVCSNEKQTIPPETKIKSHLRKINLKKDFPSQIIYKAYIQPIVDETNTKFQWGFPDLDELRNFAINTIGWTKLKVNEILLPVMKKLGQQRSSQMKITQFLPVMFSQNDNRKKSKRVRRAVAALTNKVDPAESTNPKKKPRRNVRTKKKVEVKKETGLNLSESSSGEE